MRFFSMKPVALLLLTMTSGCVATTVDEYGLEQPIVTKSALPSAVRPYPEIEETLACIKGTGALEGRRFRVGAFADSTGKVNAVADGATGNFLPQGGSSAYITDAIRRAGGQVITGYFGDPEEQIPADYAVNGIFNSLDFGRPVDADLRISGIGPIIVSGWAQVSLAIQLDDDKTRLNHQLSLVQRPVKFQQLGVGVGRDFDGTLVTGTASFSSQQRLQLEALNGPIALGVADVLINEFPDARAQCGNAVDRLMYGDTGQEDAV